MRTQIIIFSTRTIMSFPILKQLSKNDTWDVYAMFNAEAAIEMMQRQNINMIIFVDAEKMDENKLRKVGTILNEDIVFLDYCNQPSLEKAVFALLNQQRLRKQVGYSFVDNTLKYENQNISLN